MTVLADIAALAKKIAKRLPVHALDAVIKAFGTVTQAHGEMFVFPWHIQSAEQTVPKGKAKADVLAPVAFFDAVMDLMLGRRDKDLV